MLLLFDILFLWNKFLLFIQLYFRAEILVIVGSTHQLKDYFSRILESELLYLLIVSSLLNILGYQCCRLEVLFDLVA